MIACRELGDRERGGDLTVAPPLRAALWVTPEVVSNGRVSIANRESTDSSLQRCPSFGELTFSKFG